MGYTTEFEGQFDLDDQLTEAQTAYLKAFSNTRRMKRDAEIVETFEDPIRKAAGLPVGKEGEYFVVAGGFAGQDRDKSIVDYNNPPRTQPGLWCKWVPNYEANGIEWNGAEKFYYYVEWLEYIIDNFLKPWGHILNGRVRWRGEEMSDIGVITVKNNKVSVKKVKF